MDRDQRSRRQKAAATPPPNRRPAPRSMKSRLGLTKQGQPSANRQAPNGRTGGQASRPQQRPTAQRNAGNAAGTRRPQPQQNPQKPAYRQNPNRRPPRCVTHAEQLRRRRRRAILGMLLVLAALVAGIILSINLLFKVTDFRVENTDGSTPANTGIYTEDQIIDLLGIAEGDSLFGFSTQEKSQLLLNSLPYLDVAEVDTQMPSTVVVKVQPATERFMMEYGGQWLVLSDHLKVLRTSDSQPEDLIWLEANAPQGQPTTPGSFLSVQQSEEQATAETSHISAQDTLEQLMQELEANNLLAGVSVIDMTDLTELNFLYQGRVSVTLGTANNLDYKIRFAATLILDVDGTGLTASDRGTLDVSRQLEDGNIEATFNADTSTPTPEPTPEGDTDTGDGDSSEEPTPAPEPTPEPEG